MIQNCADEFDIEGTNSIYQHDDFFDTWCYEESVFMKWTYDIKLDHYKLYLAYLFTADEYKLMIPKIIPEHNEVHILKLHNVIKLNQDKGMCELYIETVSHDENDDGSNVCWENSIIQMVLNVILPVYKDLYASF